MHPFTPSTGVQLAELSPASLQGQEDFFNGQLIEPGSSVLFVLDREGNMQSLLQSIKGLGGKVLKTTVDLAHAQLIQSSLAAASDKQ